MQLAVNLDQNESLQDVGKYGAIKRLLADELIAETEERPAEQLDDERRRYYCITELGRKVIALEAKRLANLVDMAVAKQLLHPTT